MTMEQVQLFHSHSYVDRQGLDYSRKLDKLNGTSLYSSFSEALANRIMKYDLGEGHEGLKEYRDNSICQFCSSQRPLTKLT